MLNPREAFVNPQVELKAGLAIWAGVTIGRPKPAALTTAPFRLNSGALGFNSVSLRTEVATSELTLGMRVVLISNNRIRANTLICIG